MTGFHRAALTVAMKRAFRTVVRPPMIMRRPRIAPLSRLMGATPTKAAMRRRSSKPSSGSSAISVRAVIGPMPGTEASRSSVSRQTGMPRTVPLRSRSISPSSCCSQARWRSRLLWSRRSWVCRWRLGPPDSPRASLGQVVDLSNRRVRTRTHGGVGGREGQPSLRPNSALGSSSYRRPLLQRPRPHSVPFLIGGVTAAAPSPVARSAGFLPPIER